MRGAADGRKLYREEKKKKTDKDGYELNTQCHFAAWSFCGA